VNVMRCRIETIAGALEHRGLLRRFKDVVSGELVFEVIGPEDARFYRDYRKKSPFLQILPCPYCGVAEDRGHDPKKHINTHLLTEVVSGSASP